MFNRSRGLATAVLLTGALVTLSACNGDTSDSDAAGTGSSGPSASASASASDDTSGTSASSRGQAAGSKAKGKPAAKSNGTGGTAANSSAKGKVGLPAPGSYMKVAAVGDDVISGHKAIFYSVTQGDGQSALDNYMRALQSAGFITDSDNADSGEASKQGVDLTLGATQSFSVNGLVVIEVEGGSVSPLPSAPAGGDLQNAVPELTGENNFIADGDVESGDQVAFYNADSDFVDLIKNGGYACAANQQDGEAVKDFYRCSKDGVELNVEVAKNSILGGLGIVTPVG